MSDTGQKIINEVRLVAAANPDFVYEPPDDEGCVYVRDGEPSCLIGHALWRLGYIDAELERHREGPNHNWDGAPDLLDHLGLHLDDSESEWVAVVQSRQDDGQPWGHTVGIS